MGTGELSWDDEYVPDGEEHAAAMQTAFDAAARILGAAIPGGNDFDPDQAAGEVPLDELAQLTGLIRWVTGVRDELLLATRDAYELNERTGPGSWQELADALRITRTPVRQQYDFLREHHRRGGGLGSGLLSWDAKHRKPPTVEELRRSGRGSRENGGKRP